MEKPVIMEAENRYVAYDMLKELSFKSQVPIDMKKLEDMRVETPIIGISKKKRGGQDYVWVGKDHSANGWMLQSEFEQINKK